MNWIGVITGDIINSTEILNAGQRNKLLQVMHQTVDEMNKQRNWGELKIDIYRGDSFQIACSFPALSVAIAISFRARLIACSSKDIRWDARLGIGVGKGEFIAKKVTESDGEAFHLSGQAFDQLDKNRLISVLTPDNDFNTELKVSTAFVDDIVSGWTPTQADVFYLYFAKELNQREIAEIEEKSPQAISKMHIAAKSTLIGNYMTRVTDKILFLSSQKS